ncbi:hypothetical protein TREPR_1994 [Treponema primitia ZAS-2]|uniref:Guanylate cyclase domain-containing protein n=1 Tax=Treponema primitia (strain ATCC BAA-887 / DSM 12427 / ZAS-2) TaxID=545694 RepID=F5YKE1_TREPZ|nr:hypothetical protein TREPR_1994 [Treponema primitia ZAS-2]
MLIETRLSQEDFIDPSAASQVLMTLTEMGADTLIIQTPVLENPSFGGNFPGVSGDSSGSPGIRSRFDGEFALVERNIRNLFEAIRLGFILPSEAERYVGELVIITERGKDRLLQALVPQEKQEKLLEHSAGVFGRLYLPGLDLYLGSAKDWDGKIRRIAPVMIREDGSEAEHIVFAALKSAGTFSAGPEGDFPLPTDETGALLFIPPNLEEQDFRRIPLAAFQEYEEADREFGRLLTNAENQGIYKDLDPVAYPGYLHKYTEEIRDELLAAPDQEKKDLWLNARAGYFKSLDEFFNGPSETSLVDGYERMIASESLGVEGIRRVTVLRNELILTFRNLREKYAELLRLRSAMEAELSGAFCILGAPGENSDLESSALMANTLLTGRVFSPDTGQDTLVWSLLGVLVILTSIALTGPWVSLGLGLVLTAALGFGFSESFILRSYWMDPLIPLSGALAGIISSFVFALLAKYREANRLRRAYGPRMDPSWLKGLIRAGGPGLSETLNTNAAIVVVREGNLKGLENRSSPQEAAQAASAFLKEVLKVFGKAGGVLSGIEGDTAVFAFGSPLERRAMTKMKGAVPYDDRDKVPAPQSPGARAASLVKELLEKSPPSWRFALDTGECAFSWSAATGYTAAGHPVISARLLSGLTQRYKTRNLVSSRICSLAPDLAAKKLGALVDQNNNERKEFFELQ